MTTQGTLLDGAPCYLDEVDTFLDHIFDRTSMNTTTETKEMPNSNSNDTLMIASINSVEQHLSHNKKHLLPKRNGVRRYSYFDDVETDFQDDDDDDGSELEGLGYAIQYNNHDLNNDNSIVATMQVEDEVQSSMSNQFWHQSWAQRLLTTAVSLSHSFGEIGDGRYRDYEEESQFDMNEQFQNDHHDISIKNVQSNNSIDYADPLDARDTPPLITSSNLVLNLFGTNCFPTQEIDFVVSNYDSSIHTLKDINTNYFNRIDDHSLALTEEFTIPTSRTTSPYDWSKKQNQLQQQKNACYPRILEDDYCENATYNCHSHVTKQTKKKLHGSASRCTCCGCFWNWYSTFCCRCHGRRFVRVICVLAFLLITIGCVTIVVTLVQSRNNNGTTNENVFRRTWLVFRKKQKTTTNNNNPTLTETETNQTNTITTTTTTKKCFETTMELRNVVQEYFHTVRDDTTTATATKVQRPTMTSVQKVYGNYIGNWCVDKIKDFSYVFANQHIIVTKDWYGDEQRDDVDDDRTMTKVMWMWNTSLATNMSGMFQNLSFDSTDTDLALNNLLSTWDVSNVIDMSYMFANIGQSTSSSSSSSSAAALINDLNISLWNVSSVQSMAYMFAGTSDFNNPSISLWDVSSVITMEGMFSGASDFNQSLVLWDVSNVRTMKYMFSSATYFDNDSISFWDVSTVQDMSYMFLGAKQFNSDLILWNVQSVTDMTGMFFDAQRFNRSLALWNVSSVLYMDQMFYGAISFNQNISTWDVSSVLSMSSMFGNAHTFNQDLSTWNVSSVRTMFNMFFGTYAFDQNISMWNVSNVHDMSWMFESSIQFNQDLSRWDVSAVYDMTGMFYNATTFQQDISLWNVSNVQSMEYMFYDAKSFQSNISLWNVTNVQNFGSMFAHADRFNQSLCSWGNQIVSIGTVPSSLASPTLKTDTAEVVFMTKNISFMFEDTPNCPSQDSEPDLSLIVPSPFCHVCF